MPDDKSGPQIQEVFSAIPVSEAERGVMLQGALHSQALSAILMCCFCLESYANSLAYFLFLETDFLRLGSHRAASETLIEAIEWMSPGKKWETIGRLSGRQGFDKSRGPFQDFVALFRFRDDHVHDKAIGMSEDRSSRYGGRFPEPVFGALDLTHVLLAAKTYWEMVEEVHDLLAVPPGTFQRHYNLMPWRDDAHRQQLENVAQSYLFSKVSKDSLDPARWRWKPRPVAEGSARLKMP